MADRLDLNSFNQSDQQRLVSLMLQYIDDSVVNEHADAMDIAHTYDERFFIWHRNYIGEMETWLSNNNGSEFVPLPYWSPDTQVPSVFMVVKPHDDGTPRDPPTNPGPIVSNIPSNFTLPTLCDFNSADDLGNQVELWHDTIHNDKGGTMAEIMQAPAAPIFFCWHAFIDTIYANYLSCSS